MPPISKNERTIVALVGVAFLIIVACAAETFLLSIIQFVVLITIGGSIAIAGVYLLANIHQPQTKAGSEEYTQRERDRRQ